MATLGEDRVREEEELARKGEERSRKQEARVRKEEALAGKEEELAGKEEELAREEEELAREETTPIDSMRASTCSPVRAMGVKRRASGTAVVIGEALCELMTALAVSLLGGRTGCATSSSAPTISISSGFRFHPRRPLS